MSALVKFFCSFCKEEITNRSINPEHMGHCIFAARWTNDLELNLKGPHICQQCVHGLSEARQSYKVR